MDFVSYYRVSTRKQGVSGLGLDAPDRGCRLSAVLSGWGVVTPQGSTVRRCPLFHKQRDNEI